MLRRFDILFNRIASEYIVPSVAESRNLRSATSPSTSSISGPDRTSKTSDPIENGLRVKPTATPPAMLARHSQHFRGAGGDRDKLWRLEGAR